MGLTFSLYLYLLKTPEFTIGSSLLPTYFANTVVLHYAIIFSPKPHGYSQNFIHSIKIFLIITVYNVLHWTLWII